MGLNSYFSLFNIINYSNTQVVDITERVIVQNNNNRNPYNYYPMDISNGARPDTIAYNSYKNPYTDWILYLSNNIVDPYYEWYMTPEQFTEFIIVKYGSVETAQNKIMYFTNNWTDQNDIDPSTFDALTINQQNYWVPNYNSTTIISYSRKATDWTTTTNFIIDLSITGNSNFSEDELVYITYDPTNNPSVTGQGQVLVSNTTDVIIQHVLNNAYPNGNVVITSNSYVYGTENNSNCIITACTFLANNIVVDVAEYWSPVYYYDYENLKNEGNKIILTIQPNLVSSFVQETASLLANVNIEI